VSNPPCPHCGGPQAGPAPGIGFYCEKGFDCEGKVFEEPDTVTITISRKDAEVLARIYKKENLILPEEIRLIETIKKEINNEQG